MDMDSKLSHIDQYKMLREEIMEYTREIYRTEVYVAFAVGSIYTWLMLHTDGIKTPIVWFIAPCLIFLSAIRCLIFVVRIKSIGRYLRRIEEVAFGKEARLPGWEQYKGGFNRLDIFDNIIATLAWVLAFAGSIIISWKFSRL